MKGKHAQKNFGAVGAYTTISQNPGGPGGGVSHTRTGPGHPPRGSCTPNMHQAGTVRAPRNMLEETEMVNP